MNVGQAGHGAGLKDYDEVAVMDPSQNARYSADDKLFVQFYMRAVQNKFESNQQGRPIFDEKEYIKIMIPGDRNSNVDSPVTPEYKMRFAERYSRFKSNEKQAQSGTPIDIWPQMTVGRVAELKALNIFTVEQIAALDDGHAHKIMGFNDLRNRAQAFLATAEGDAENSKLAAELAKRDVEIQALKEQINQIIQAQTDKPKRK